MNNSHVEWMRLYIKCVVKHEKWIYQATYIYQKGALNHCNMIHSYGNLMKGTFNWLKIYLKDDWFKRFQLIHGRIKEFAPITVDGWTSLMWQCLQIILKISTYHVCAQKYGFNKILCK